MVAQYCPQLPAHHVVVSKSFTDKGAKCCFESVKDLWCLGIIHYVAGKEQLEELKPETS